VKQQRIFDPDVQSLVNEAELGDRPRYTEDPFDKTGIDNRPY
jgi:hypothetical protein